MSRKLVVALVFAIAASLVAGGNVRASPSTFTVNSTGDAPDSDTADGICDDDTGNCTLRAAIEQANATPGTDTIAFNIPGSGPHTIQPASALPTITDPVVIDGYTQPGATPNTNPVGLGINAVLRVEIDGSTSGCCTTGLEIDAENSTVRGLAVNRFPRVGIAVGGSGGTVIEGNFIGTDVTGAIKLGNAWVGLGVSDSTNNTIGGDAAESRNLISGNGQGVQVSSSLSGRATGNIVRGNYIGTDITGSASLGNTISGVLIDGAANSIIGGETSTSRNVVSGNGSHGVCLLTSAAKGNVVEGNFIGIDATGTRKLPNRMEGVAVLGGSSNIIGGTTAGSGNVISGNGRHGVSLHDAQNVVQGNYIGTDVTGTIALGNSGVGVDVTAAWGNTIGGTVSEARNVISANATGVALGLRSSHGNVVQGNLIGTDVTGTTVLGNTVDGLIVHSDAYGNTIGGTAAGARNVISGNGRYGAHIGGEHTEQNVVQGNYIGTDLASAVALGNGSDGVHLAYGTFNNTIGGASEGAVNTIAFNGGDGVSVESGTGNTILSNRIFLNTDLGIDLGPGGVTPNDPYDADLGANNLQNFPVLTSAAPNGGNTAIAGSINSTSGTAFRIEFFSSGTCDPSGHGEGRDLLGSTAVTTDASGDADIAVTFPIVIPVGQFITATATDPNDNSSEFSRCIVVDADIDADGCSYAEETAGAHHPKPGSTCTGSTACYDDNAWHDFYDVPVPAHDDPGPNGQRNQAINVQDVVGVLRYAGTSDNGPDNGHVDYDSDKDGDGIEDGRDYDRSPGPLPNPPHDAGPPDGAVNLQDVTVVLRQVGLSCAGPP